MSKEYRAPTNWRALCEELADALACHYPGHVDDDELIKRARAALTEPDPIPLSERKPGPEDCNELNLCWFWLPDINGHEDLGDWQLQDQGWATDPDTDYTHWQPFHAISRPS